VKALLGPVLKNEAPVPYVPRTLTFPWLPRANMEQNMRAYGQVGTLHAIVSRLANATSQVNWRLYRSSKSGKPEDRVEVTDHLALRIWDSPNPFMTRQEFVEASQQHVELTGEGWSVIARNPRARSLPLELWPVRPDRMAPVPSASNFLSGYLYTGPGGERIPFEKDSVLFIRVPDPLDPYRGLSPVGTISATLDSSRFADEYNRNFFYNSAEPGGIIQVDKRLTDDEFNELRDRWEEQHKGVARAHTVAVLEQGEWKQNAATRRDMQFVELSDVTDAKIRTAFGFPKFMLGDVDDVNRAQGEASDAMFAQWLIVPRLVRWRQMLNTDYLPLFGTAGQGLEFDFDDPVMANTEIENAGRDSKVAAAVALMGAGADKDETMAAFGLPTITFTEPEPAPQPPLQATAEVVPQVEALTRLVLEARARDDDRSDDRRFPYWH